GGARASAGSGRGVGRPAGWSRPCCGVRPGAAWGRPGRAAFFFFFQPLDLHVEPTDLLVEFGLDGLALVPLAATAVAEERLGAVEELLLPLTDLDLKGLRQLGQGPGLLGGLQGDPGLEGRGIALACACHDAPRDGTVNSDEFNIPSGPVFGVHLSSIAKHNDEWHL